MALLVGNGDGDCEDVEPATNTFWLLSTPKPCYFFGDPPPR